MSVFDCASVHEIRDRLCSPIEYFVYTLEKHRKTIGLPVGVRVARLWLGVRVVCTPTLRLKVLGLRLGVGTNALTSYRPSNLHKCTTRNSKTQKPRWPPGHSVKMPLCFCACQSLHTTKGWFCHVNQTRWFFHPGKTLLSTPCQYVPLMPCHPVWPRLSLHPTNGWSCHQNQTRWSCHPCQHRVSMSLKRLAT
jgi:hypothetical protein